MQRCRACEATMTPAELHCLRCGTSATREDPRLNFQLRCRTGIKCLFVVSAVMSVASLFISLGPSFITCVAATFVLFLVKTSADQMLFDHDKK